MKNQIDMQDKRIVNVKFPRFGFHDAMGYAFFTNDFFKPGANRDINCNQIRLYNTGSYSNNNQLITGVISEKRYLRKDQSNIKMNGKKKVTNAHTPTRNNDLTTKAYFDSRLNVVSPY